MRRGLSHIVGGQGEFSETAGQSQHNATSILGYWQQEGLLCRLTSPHLRTEVSMSLFFFFFTAHYLWQT